MRRRYRDVSPAPHTHTCILSLSSTSLTRMRLFLKQSESILTHHDHPESLITHTLGFTLGIVHSMGFGQMYNNAYLSGLYHTEYFHCHRNPLCSAYSSPLPHSLAPGKHFSVYCLHSLFLFQNVIYESLKSCLLRHARPPLPASVAFILTFCTANILTFISITSPCSFMSWSFPHSFPTACYSPLLDLLSWAVSLLCILQNIASVMLFHRGNALSQTKLGLILYIFTV